jgi:hypothetical protein
MRFALIAAFLCGCTQGTTPDCSQIMCGPDLDATIVDVGTDVRTDAPSDAGDAGSDASSDSSSDAPADSPSG